MTTPFIRTTEDTSIGARANRAIMGAFSVAIVATVGVMTFAQYIAIA